MKKKNKQEDILKLYAGLKHNLQELEDQIAQLEPEVMATLEDMGVDTLRETYGTYSIVYRKKWTYPSEITEKEMQYQAIIKQEKVDAQVSGEAKAEEIKGLSYRKYEPKP